MSAANLVLSEEETMLRSSARSFLGAQSPVADVRALRDDPGSAGVRAKVWQQMVELEWPAMAIDDADGGVGAGYYPLGVIFEELGRNLVLSPLLTVCQALACLQRTGHQRATAVRAETLNGRALVVLADQETAHHDPGVIGTRFEETSDGYILGGTKRFVLHGGQADAYVVSARLVGTPPHHAEGTALFLVDAADPGVSIERFRLIDSQPRAHLRFTDVALSRSALIADPKSGAEVLAECTEVATALLAAEMLGSLSAALELTVAHLRQRVQFGVPIGSFQALQHRAARMLVAQEMTTSAVRAALRALDEDPGQAAAAVSVAKIWANDAFQQIAREGVQMHGGLGMTDEADIGLYLKRAQVASAQSGDSRFHRRRIATLKLDEESSAGG
jgi:alkylation response protein AidB-like acyl-CoA dehydrogenase